MTEETLSKDLISRDLFCSFDDLCTSWTGGCNDLAAIEINLACADIDSFENVWYTVTLTDFTTAADFCASLVNNGKEWDEQSEDDSFNLGGFCEQYADFCVDGFPDLDAVCDNVDRFPYEVFAGNSFINICEVDFSDICEENPELCATTGEFTSDLCSMYPEQCD